MTPWHIALLRELSTCSTEHHVVAYENGPDDFETCRDRFPRPRRGRNYMQVATVGNMKALTGLDWRTSFSPTTERC
jgi:hypothetical protein